MRARRLESRASSDSSSRFIVTLTLTPNVLELSGESGAALKTKQVLTRYRPLDGFVLYLDLSNVRFQIADQ